MKKGFTLIELLAVIVILGIVALIVSNSAIGTINKSKKSLSKTQINTIEKAAEKWGTVNPDEMPLTGSISVNITKLADEGYLDSSDLKDPANNSKLCGVVKITYTNNQYKYEFVQNKC